MPATAANKPAPGTPPGLLPIAITMGDPAGIGPEIILRSLLRLQADGDTSRYLVYGDPAWFQCQAERLGLDGGRMTFRASSTVPPGLASGRINAAAGDAAFLAVRQAALDAMAGRVRAVVTAPLNKAAMNLAGHAYPGHTEILAEMAGGVPVRMMLANDELRTVLVTIHLPLRQAIDALTRDRVLETIHLTRDFLVRGGLASPRIAVAGLNPHAGEDGLLGREEIDIIAPAVAAAREAGIDASGPHPPDTVFMRARGFAAFDVVIAMYHDQGLIPVKYLGLDEGVNITVGLPFVRTSPDHGTAFDIAGQGRADPRSLLAAIRLADRLSGGVSGASPPVTNPAANPVTPLPTSAGQDDRLSQ